MSKSKLEQAFDKARKEKYGVDRLEVETTRTPRPISLETKEAKYFREHMEAIKDKYNLPHGLEVEGLSRAKETTLEDVVIEHDRQESKNMKLAVGAVNYKGRQVKIWFERTK